MKLSRPLISVLLPVRNAALWLGAAIESLLVQTYASTEVIVIDNGSTDQSNRIARSFADTRVRVIEQPSGFLVSALNSGLSAARGDLIARQDADDVSLPLRFEVQVRLLQRDSSLAIVGSSFDRIDVNGRARGAKLAVTTPAEIRAQLRVGMPFAGASIVGWRRTFIEAGGYDPSFDGHVGEDYDFLVRIAERYAIGACPDVLYVYRTGNAASMCGTIGYQYADAHERVRQRAFARGSQFFAEATPR